MPRRGISYIEIKFPFLTLILNICSKMEKMFMSTRGRHKDKNKRSSEQNI